MILYHVTSRFAMNSIPYKGIRASFDDHLSAKEMEKGTVVNLVDLWHLPKLLHSFALLDPDNTTFFPEVILKVEVEDSSVQKVHHSKWSFIWYISRKSVPVSKIRGFIQTQDWINGSDRWKNINDKLWD